MADEPTPSFEILDSYKGAKGFFIKSFLMDDTVNLRGWKITAEAIKEILPSFLTNEFFGKTAPFIIREDHAHPEPREHESMLVLQEPDRKGDILDVGFEEKEYQDGATIKAWQVARIDDKKAQAQLRSKAIQFISPSIRVLENHVEDGVDIVTKGIGSHNAGVDTPAYGMQKAQIKGICEDDHHSCMTQLANVQANSKEVQIGTIEKHACGSITISLSANSVPSCLSEKLSKGETATKQDIAICFNENESAGLDTQSLENITRPELLIKKKDENATNPPIESNLKDKTKDSKIRMPNTKSANTVEPNSDGTCPEGMLKGEDGMCHLTAASYQAQEEEEKKEKEETDESASDEKNVEVEESKKTESASVRKLKSEVTELKDLFASEVRDPLVAKIVNSKTQLGLIKSADARKEVSRLNTSSIAELKSMNADFEKLLNKDASEEDTQVRFDSSQSHMSADAGDNDEKSKSANGYSVVQQIRDRMN